MINKEKNLFTKIFLNPHLGVILVFLLVSFFYFQPSFDGKVLHQTDIHQFEGMSKELKDYYNNEGISSAWTGTMFSGMPSYLIGVWGKTPNLLGYVVDTPFKALGSSGAGPMFAGMVMAYILFLVMGIGVVPAAIGAVAYSFSSYNIIIVEAGHVTKAWAIAYMPLVIASIMVLYRKKYLLGGLLMAVGLSLQIKSNHLQITYYVALLCLVLYLGLVVKNILNKDIKSLLKSSGVLAVAVVLAILSNYSALYTTYEMSKESIRGKSELTQISETETQSSGLDKEYAFAWSYGKAETFSLLIPDIHGGKSGGTLGTDSHIYQELKAQGAQVPADGVPQMPTYWGDQPFTSGPVYFGAIICFLFVLGMLIIQNRLKWVLFAATVFFIFLSWGRNFEAFNDFFFYYFPFYNKFRAVSMALVIPALTMVMIAVWGIKAFIDEKLPKKQLLKSLYIAGGTTAGFCLFMWLLPDFFFNFTIDADAQWSTQYPDWFYTAILQDRKAMLSADALRSFLFIAIACAALWGMKAAKGKGNKTLLYTCAIAVFFLVLGDLWGVDKRYVNHGMYQSRSVYDAQKFPKSKADEAILADKAISYRVLNLNNPFNESSTSYYHKSIGGYHAAKLKRYQELIDRHLQSEVNEIINSFSSQNIDTIMAAFEGLTAINMLNGKYIVFNPEQPPLENPYHLGNAWFVNAYSLVNNADEEIDALNRINPAKEVVIDKKFESELSSLNLMADSLATIVMTEYKPDRVTYKSNAHSEQLAVFSEVFYPHGWQAFVDGQPVSHFRGNWILRAMRIPAGEHTIEFKFIPQGYYTAVLISEISSGLLVLLLAGFFVLFIITRRKNAKKE